MIAQMLTLECHRGHLCIFPAVFTLPHTAKINQNVTLGPVAVENLGDLRSTVAPLS